MARPSRHIFLALLVCSLLAAVIVSAAAEAPEAGAHSKTTKAKLLKNKPVYDGLWKRRVSSSNKRWARRVADCESSRNPNALSAKGHYRGAFQFASSTWKHAPRSPGGDPVAYSYKTQAFVAVRLKVRDGRSPWPNC